MTKENKKKYLSWLEDISGQIAVIVDDLPNAGVFWSDWTDLKDSIEEELNNID